MTKCTLCPNPIGVDERAVSIVGGYFPSADPDLFMMDQEVLRESYAHLACLVGRIAQPPKGPT